jgi:hypothetical protein
MMVAVEHRLLAEYKNLTPQQAERPSGDQGSLAGVWAALTKCDLLRDLKAPTGVLSG